jgi:plasmid stabilization system protein ParE
MSYDVSYLPQAEQDLIEILAYGIENWGEKLAESMYLKITEQLETLYFSPNRTKRKGSLGTREMLISDSPYRAIIQVDEETKQVFILRILHTARNI